MEDEKIGFFDMHYLLLSDIGLAAAFGFAVGAALKAFGF